VRILLVGCSGFVGRALVPGLLEAGHSLTLVSRGPQPLPGVQHPQLQRLQADPANPASWEQPALKQALAEAEAVVNLAGEPIAEDDDLFGSTVILAARIAACAGGGEILVPEAVRHLLAGKDYRYHDHGETTLKGFDEPVHLYRVDWTPAGD
jgi:class 3 adenylate cyclase